MLIENSKENLTEDTSLEVEEFMPDLTPAAQFLHALYKSILKENQKEGAITP